MPNIPIRNTDLRGAVRLGTDAVTGVVDLVEALHHTIVRLPGRAGAMPGRTGGLTGLVYRSVRGVTRLVGGGVDAVLGRLAPLPGDDGNSAAREAVLAAINGVLGDHLAASGNPLAIPMQLRSEGRALPLQAAALAAALPDAGGRLLVLLHGLCMNDLQWRRQGHDHGAELARELGWTPVYLHYNSGLHISANGRACAEQLEALLAAWPVPIERFAIVGHSMGGLVARSACHHAELAGLAWRWQLQQMVFLGSPHHGAPLERGGNWIDILLGASAYSAPFSRLGKIRSAGITDLRHGNLQDEDWAGRDRFARMGDRRLPLPLPDGVACYAIAASTARRPGSLGERLIGDGLVPLASALGRHDDPRFDLAFPAARQWVGYGLNHLDLLSDREVYECLRRWLAEPAGAG
ncbi:esterase/lipase family protein [Chitinimonas koreensis]|uniref:esterase/lipase family protein n=1 Tax=Chitinimonas koreensis TaxID=356302 RepID=UPI0003FA7800|nr:permease [Chitinimonas koreensis]QNM98634.1 alpha/beta hydrolase [Chitinimonas koreensis]